MSDPHCIFCKIIAGSMGSKTIRENEHVIAIENIAPKAPIHYLIIPKTHITNIKGLTDEHQTAVWEVLKMARDLSNDIPEADAFNFISNNGAGAGQSVFHMHWHFIAGKNIYRAGL